MCTLEQIPSWASLNCPNNIPWLFLSLSQSLPASSSLTPSLNPFGADSGLHPRRTPLSHCMVMH